jgi:hypothetical protein
VGRFSAAAVAALSALALVGIVAPYSGADEGWLSPWAAYADEVGDSGKADDLRSVRVRNDFAGDYSFTATLASPVVAPRAVFFYLNTDLDESTGSPSGAEYLIIDYPNDDFRFARWNGSEWVVNGAAGIDIGTPHAKNAVAFAIRKSDIGGVRHFDFFVLSQRYDGIDDRDVAPSGETGMWRYDFVSPPVVNAGSFTTPAKAGATWTVALRATRSATGATITNGKIFCVAATATNQILRIVASGFRRHGGDTFATCRFAVPRALKGKFVGSRIDITADGLTVSRHFHSTGK